MVEVGEIYKLLVNGNISVYAERSIILKTQGAYISISNDKILIQGDKIVTLNGESVSLDG